MKLSIKLISLSLITVSAVLLIEAIVFYGFLTGEETIATADAVVVFHGGPGRVEEGYRLVNDGVAPFLVISPAKLTTLNRYDSIYGRNVPWRHIVETKAATTFQNALLAARLIRKNRLQKVILVTNAWHMPRSYLLICMAFTGSEVEILPVCPPKAAYAQSPLKWTSRQWKQIYNEMVQFWGSVSELIMYRIRGELPDSGLKEPAWVVALRRMVLVKVN